MLRLAVADHRWRRPASHRVSATWADAGGRPFAVGCVRGDDRWIEWSGLGVFRFRRDSPVVTFHPDAGVAPDRARSFFARIVQPVILQAQGRIVLHGSAVGGDRGALVFCGQSGSGKSTLAAALPRFHPLAQLADDAVLISPGSSPDAPYEVQPLPFRPRLRPPTAAYLGDAVTPTDLEPGPLPLRAIVSLEQVARAEPGDLLERIAPAPAFRAVLTHAHAFDTDDRQESAALVERHLALAASTPVYRLAYCPDFSALPALAARVAALLEPPREPGAR